MVNRGAEQRSLVLYQLEFVKSFVSFIVGLSCGSPAGNPTNEHKTWQSRVTHLCPFFLQDPKPLQFQVWDLPSTRKSSAWIPYPGKKQVLPRLLNKISTGMVQWTSVLLNPPHMNSHVDSISEFCVCTDARTNLILGFLPSSMMGDKQGTHEDLGK